LKFRAPDWRRRSGRLVAVVLTGALAMTVLVSGRVKDHLDHSSIRVTSDRYGHLFPSAKAALADSLEDAF
jgi:hypothetical protein